MGGALRRAAPGAVCVIGADIPDINRNHIARAFSRLGRADAVFGPAPDGGYWLIGLKRVKAIPPGLFMDVRWSSEFALADTAATLSGHQIAYADTLQDVDTVDDLAMTSVLERDS
jgi:glycosyltransferase A (GT-A) superfamily protein (DUF2064 family)